MDTIPNDSPKEGRVEIAGATRIKADHDLRHSIRIFLALTLALSVPAYLLILTGISTAYILLMYCPGTAALVTLLLCRLGFGEVGLRFPKFRYFAIALLLVVASTLPLYLLVWFTGFGRFSLAAIKDNPDLKSLPIGPMGILALNAVFGIPVNLFAAFGEEFGWRGFLVPQLRKTTTFWRLALFTGIVWAVWHWPLIVLGEYNAASIPRWASVVFFTTGVVLAGIGFAWLRLASGSIWPCVVMHGVGNFWTQACLDPLTQNTGHTEWLTGEFGIGSTLTGLVILALMWPALRHVASGDDAK